MPALNKVILIGHFTRDPELKYTGKGTALANGAIAVNRHWTGESGEKKEEVAFVDFTAWSKQAETLCQYTAKGSCVMLEGYLRYEQWEKDDEKRSKLVLVVENFQFLDYKNEAQPAHGNAAAAAPKEKPQPTTRATRAAASSTR